MGERGDFQSVWVICWSLNGDLLSYDDDDDDDTDNKVKDKNDKELHNKANRNKDDHNKDNPYKVENLFLLGGWFIFFGSNAYIHTL